MDCKEIEKIILKFIHKECSHKEIEMMIEHIKHCPECKEELTIQFLLKEGINRLENGESFDLNAELEKRLKEHTDTEKRRRFGLDAERYRILMDLLAGLLIAGVVAVLLLWKVQ